jgi:hypothetical protein
MSDIEANVEVPADAVEEEDRATNIAAVEAAANKEQEERIAAKEAEDAAEEARLAAEKEAAAAEVEAAAKKEQEERIAAKEAEDAAEEARLAAEQEAAAAAAAEAAEVARKEAEEAAAAREEKARRPSAVAMNEGIAQARGASSGSADTVDDLWAKLTDRKDPTNWVACYAKGKRGNKLRVSGCGAGGFTEAKAHMLESKYYFIGMKVDGVDQRDTVSSVRSKYIVASYIGPGVKTMQRAGGGMLKATLTNAWHGASVWFNVPSLENFTHDELKNRLLQCGGAHKPTFYDFGDGVKVNLDFYSEHVHGGR